MAVVHRESAIFDFPSHKTRTRYNNHQSTSSSAPTPYQRSPSSPTLSSLVLQSPHHHQLHDGHQSYNHSNSDDITTIMNNNINNISLPEGSLNNDLNIRSRPLQFRRQRSLSETSDSTVVPSSFAREVANSGSNGKKLAHGSTLFSSSSSSIYSSSARVLSSSASHIPSLQYQQNPNSSLHSRGSGFLNTSPSSTSPQTTTLNANAIVAKDARVDNQSQSSSNGSSNNNNGSIQQASPIRASNGPSNSDNKNNTLINRTTRQSVDSQQSLSPKTLQAILVTLQLLSLVPAFIGVCYCLYRAIFLISLPISRVDSDEAAKLQNFTEKHENQKSWNKRIEWLLCAMWAALSGNYCHSMARGLTRRWLVYYPLPAAVIRLVSQSFFLDSLFLRKTLLTLISFVFLFWQVSLQVICWPLTKFTVVNFFGKDDLQLPAWIVCAVTAAISNTIQIW